MDDASQTKTTKTHPDSFGRHWVYVTQAEVLGHPKGSLGLGVIACAAWLIAIGGLEVWAWSATLSLNLALAVGLLLAGLGLILRNRVAYLGAIILPLFLILRLFFNVRVMALAANVPIELYILFNGVAAALVVFYLFEGDRPNFLYRLRYRSYRAEAEQK